MFPKGIPREGYPGFPSVDQARLVPLLESLHDPMIHMNNQMRQHHPTIVAPTEFPVGINQGIPVAAVNVLQSIPNSDLDSIIQVHRRKMQRRQANRRSAQLSRARKKVIK
jgi:hypothetical protein